MMAWRVLGKTVATVSVALMLGAACATARLDRTGVVDSQTAHAHKDDLRTLSHQRAQNDAEEEAFYLAELNRTRHLAAGLLMQRQGMDSVPERFRDLRQHYGFESSEQNTTRGIGGIVALKADEASPSRKALLEPLAKSDERFWKKLDLLEKRLEATKWDPEASLSEIYASTFRVVTPNEVASTLRSGEVAIEYLVTQEKVLAFAITPRRFETIQLTVTPQELDEKVQTLITSITCIAHPSPPGWCNKEAWKAPARWLHEAVLTPVLGAIGDTSPHAYYIVPDGPLTNLPFHLLLNKDETLLVDQAARVVYLPSFSTYLDILVRPRPVEPPRMLAIGDPANGWSPLPRLPAADKEAQVLSEVFPGSTLWRAEDAKESRFYDEVSRYNLLHFASHGLLSGQVPAASGLLLADDKDSDGLLSAAELAAVDLSHTYAVVLSACETSASGGQASSDQLTSLTAAFLTAGAPSVVGSLWQVDDRSTTLLMLSFYKHLLESGAAGALKQAQQSLRNRGYEHPFYWAAFTLWGFDQ